MITDSERRVYEILNKLDISFDKNEHPPVFTVEQARQHMQNVLGAHCKNLFLRNKKGDKHYLFICEESKRIDLKELSERLGFDRLSFASEERLDKYLGLKAGSVSPFGIINDSKHEVEVLVDRELADWDKVNFHPNINTATLTISFKDFEKFLNWIGNSVLYI